MKQSEQTSQPKPAAHLNPAWTSAVAKQWQQAWGKDTELALEPSNNTWIPLAMDWLAAVYENNPPTPILQLFQKTIAQYHWTKSQSNAWLLHLDDALQEQSLSTKEKEQIIETALAISQQSSRQEPVELLFGKEVVAQKKANSIITIPHKRDSDSIIMNEKNMTYQDLLQQTIDASFCRVEFDRTGTIVDINQNMVELLAYEEPQDLIGESYIIITRNSEEEVEEKGEIFWSQLMDGIIQKGRYACFTKTGEEVWIQASYTPIRNEEGEFVKVINIAVDVTHEVQEAHSAKVLKEAIDNSFARIEYNTSGIVQDVNENFLELFDYQNAEEVLNQHHSIFLDPQYKVSMEYEEFWNGLLEGESRNGDFKRLKKNGEELWIQSIYAPVRNKEGKVERIVKIAIDVTPQKRFLQEINKVIVLAGEEGKLDARLDARTAAGDWKTLASSVNLLLESVALPVSELGDVVAALAKGDLSIKFDSFVEGDIKELGEELNTAINSIATLMGQISQVGDLVAASAEEMLVKGEEMKNTTLEVASATQQMAEGAQQQAQQTDEASKMMDNVLVSVDTMAEKASKINTSAANGQKNSTKGLDTIKLVVENMSQIKESASSTSTSIEAFAERSEEIASALSVITDIASQTNLLALNAAIEAARAGDAGRGFAVVAEEIRKLAEGSRRSAVEIEKVIREVHKDIGAASKAIDNMEQSVKSGINASKKAEEVFESIEEANQETLHLSTEIVEATEEQRASIHATAKNIEKIVIVAEETASGTEQVASSSRVLSQGMNEVTATSEDLANVATQLQENISKFKLPE